MWNTWWSAKIPMQELPSEGNIHFFKRVSRLEQSDHAGHAVPRLEQGRPCLVLTSHRSTWQFSLLKAVLLLVCLITSSPCLESDNHHTLPILHFLFDCFPYKWCLYSPQIHWKVEYLCFRFLIKWLIWHQTLDLEIIKVSGKNVNYWQCYLFCSGDIYLFTRKAF